MATHERRSYGFLFSCITETNYNNATALVITFPLNNNYDPANLGKTLAWEKEWDLFSENFEKSLATTNFYSCAYSLSLCVSISDLSGLWRTTKIQTWL